MRPPGATRLPPLRAQLLNGYVDALEAGGPERWRIPSQALRFYVDDGGKLREARCSHARAHGRGG